METKTSGAAVFYACAGPALSLSLLLLPPSHHAQQSPAAPGAARAPPHPWPRWPGTCGAGPGRPGAPQTRTRPRPWPRWRRNSAGRGSGRPRPRRRRRPRPRAGGVGARPVGVLFLMRDGERAGGGGEVGERALFNGMRFARPRMDSPALCCQYHHPHLACQGFQLVPWGQRPARRDGRPARRAARGRGRARGPRGGSRERRRRRRPCTVIIVLDGEAVQVHGWRAGHVVGLCFAGPLPAKMKKGNTALRQVNGFTLSFPSIES
jgi:hypothetical protein